MTKAFEGVQGALTQVERIPVSSAMAKAERALKAAERALLDLDMDLDESAPA